MLAYSSQKLDNNWWEYTEHHSCHEICWCSRRLIVVLAILVIACRIVARRVKSIYFIVKGLCGVRVLKNVILYLIRLWWGIRLTIHLAFSVQTIEGCVALHAEQICFKMLSGVNAGTKQSCAENGIIIAGHLYSIDIYRAVSKTQAVLRCERALIHVADWNT